MRNRVLPLLLLLFLVSFSVTIVLTPGRDFSYAENRPLVRIPKPSLSSWRDTSFQTTLESALSDQWPASEALKAIHASIGRFGLGYTGGLLGLAIHPTEPSTTMYTKISESITPAGGNVFSLLPAGTRFPSPLSFFGTTESSKTTLEPMVAADPDPASSLQSIQSSAALIGATSSAMKAFPVYAYYLETSIDMDFLGGAVTHAYSEAFTAALPSSVHHAALRLSSTDQLRQWFYRTDHHWNAAGQQEAYAALIPLLKGESEPIVETSILTLPDVPFSGSRARSANDFTRKEPFDLLTFALPAHTVALDGVQGSYGNRARYQSGQDSTDPGFNHYGHCNGQDYAEVMYSFPQNSGKGTLLVLSDSYSNPLKPLVASHFETTRFIDLRFYENTFKKPFVIEDYIREHGVDQVLFMGSHSFFRQYPAWISGSKQSDINVQKDNASDSSEGD